MKLLIQDDRQSKKYPTVKSFYLAFGLPLPCASKRTASAVRLSLPDWLLITHESS
jgi:hypothetical protein